MRTFLKSNIKFVGLAIFIWLFFYGIDFVKTHGDEGELVYFITLGFGLLYLIMVLLLIQTITYLMINKLSIKLIRFESAYLLMGSIVSLILKITHAWQFLFPFLVSMMLYLFIYYHNKKLVKG